MRLMVMFIPSVAFGFLASCAPEPAPSGARLFAQNCVTCHGVSGRGDGPQAADLPRAPADLTRISARNGGVFPTADVMAAIHGYQGQAIHAVMPEFGSALDGPTVLWTDAEGRQIPTPAALLALARYLEGLQTE